MKAYHQAEGARKEGWGEVRFSVKTETASQDGSRDNLRLGRDEAEADELME